ncbi:MAG: type 4a pilus biogenesis protein PilO [bacterium]
MNLLYKSDPHKRISVYHILIYLIAFSISGYLSYRFILSPHLDELKKVRLQYNEEKAKLESDVERARELAKITFNVQRLEQELYEINGRLFAENEALTFMRMLPDITKQTENNLMSIVPSDSRVIQTKSNKEPNDNNIPSYKLKPIDIVIIGDYTDITRFFEQIEGLNRYITISSVNMSSSGDDASKINVKMELNLVQMDIDKELLNRMPNLQLVKQTQPINKTQLPNNQQITVNNANIQKNASVNVQPPDQQEKNIISRTASTKPTHVTKQVNNSGSSAQIVKESTKITQPVDTLNTIKQSQVVQPVKSKESLTKTETPNVKPVSNVRNNTNLIKQKERYTVQVGIFISSDNANNLVNLLKSNKYEPWIRHGYISSKTAYYVYVGNFATEKEARSLGRDMNSNLPFIKYYYIVKNIYQIDNNSEKIKDSIIIE